MIILLLAQRPQARLIRSRQPGQDRRDLRGQPIRPRRRAARLPGRDGRGRGQRAARAQRVVQVGGGVRGGHPLAPAQLGNVTGGIPRPAGQLPHPGVARLHPARQLAAELAHAPRSSASVCAQAR